jgi:hypothetical protein
MQVDKMASILIKLVMDMWITGSPLESFALILSMLQATLQQPDTQYRTRVYDLLYNLSLHVHMIESESLTPTADSARDSSGQHSVSGSMAPKLLTFVAASGRSSSARQAQFCYENRVTSTLPSRWNSCACHNTTLEHDVPCWPLEVSLPVCVLQFSQGHDGLVKGLRLPGSGVAGACCHQEHTALHKVVSRMWSCWRL